MRLYGGEGVIRGAVIMRLTVQVAAFVLPRATPGLGFGASAPEDLVEGISSRVLSAMGKPIECRNMPLL